MTPRVRTLAPTRAARRASAGLVFALTVAAAIASPRSALAVCPVISGVSATDGTNCNGVRVIWSTLDEAPEYRIHRDTDPAGSNRTVLATTASRSYTDGTAVPGTAYYYWVQGWGGICGSFSPLGTPDAGHHGVPLAPTGIASSSPACGTLRLTWNPVAGASSFDIYRSATFDFADATLVGDTTGTSYDDGTGQTGWSYWYWVRARSAAGCLGQLPAGHLARAATPPLPDLTLDPANADNVGAMTNSAGRKVIQFPTSIRNAGTAPLVLFPSWDYWDDTHDVRQRVLSCQGQIVDRYLGRFVEFESGLFVPNLVRARLRKQVPPMGLPGEVIAQVDVGGSCFEDNISWNSALPGWPATSQFTGCSVEVQGISIGWMKYESGGVRGRELDLGCVPPAIYWFELIVDPDDRFQETDESNNVVRSLVNLQTLPSPPIPSVCAGPQVEGRLVSPDSLAVAAGAPTDSIVGRVWISGLTEPAGGHELTMAEIGYRPMGVLGRGEIPWTWTPASWRRQEGAEDVYGGAITVTEPGLYEYAYRFSVFDGPWMVCDFTGSLDGFSSLETGRLLVQATTDVGDPPLVARLALEALPDPARGATRFRVSLPSASNLVVSIYDVLGRRVRTIERGARPAGVHLLDWDARDDAGRAVASGVYLARLDAGGERLSRKFLHAR
jgi:hypothetical protein